MNADDKYEQQNDVAGEAPTGDYSDNDYKSRTGQSQIPVVSDNAKVEESPYKPGTADSDQQLERDEKDAIDQSNVVGGRTRGATKQAGTYAEPGDEEGLPGPDDGTSSVR